MATRFVDGQVPKAADFNAFADSLALSAKASSDSAFAAAKSASDAQAALAAISAGGGTVAPTGIPGSVTATALTSSSVTVSWEAAANAAGYNIYRGAVKVNATPVSAFSFTDTGLAASTSYSYTVKGVNSAAVEGPVSSAAVATTGAAPASVPAKVTGVTTSSITPSSQAVGWTAVAGAVSYNVYRGGAKINTDPVIGVLFGDTGLSPSTAYVYTVTAVNAAGMGAASDPYTGTTSAVALPAAPTGLALSGATASSMTLSWNAVAGATGYNIYRGTTKDNPAPVTGLTFTDTDLAAATSYTWTVKSLNAAGESTLASNAQTASTTAAPSAGGLTAAPAKILGCYFTSWDYASSITTVPLDFNVIYLFNAQPYGPLNAAGKRDGVGDGTFYMPDAANPMISAASVQACRNRGQKVLITAGGEGAGFNFSNRTLSTNFVAWFKVQAASLGGVDGLDWNTFELWLRDLGKSNPAAVANNASEMVWISQQLVAFYGPNFMITMAPAPDAFSTTSPPYTAYSPLDGEIAIALNNAGVLTYAAQQYYYYNGYKVVNVISDFVAKWVSVLGASKVVVGLSANYDYTTSPTLAECQREYRRAVAAAPALRGAYCWSAQTNASGGNVWGAAMKIEVGPTAAGAPSAPPVTADETALTAAMAYGSGQNGAWLDVTPAYLKKDATNLVTASGDAVWTLTDRSANTNHLQRTGTNVGTYNVAGAYKSVVMDTQFASTTGGGSGDTNSAGFFCCMAVTPTDYYPFLWSDTTATGNGRRISYEAWNSSVVFGVGVGGGQEVRVAVENLAPVNTIPNIPLLIKAWQDGSTINLQVNGGAVVSSPCAACSPGSANFAVNGGFFANPGYSSSKLHYSFHTLNPLTQTLRDNAAAFVNTKKP